MSSKIISYHPAFKQAFYDLNIAWLEEYFTVEPVHLTVLQNPESSILADGGEIFFAVHNDVAVGTVAMKSYGNGRYELTKLGVADTAQGTGIGRTLCQYIINSFIQKKGRLLFLETHTILKPAMTLYEKLGFIESQNPNKGVYDGTDCYMEWHPENHDGKSS